MQSLSTLINDVIFTFQGHFLSLFMLIKSYNYANKNNALWAKLVGKQDTTEGLYGELWPGPPSCGSVKKKPSTIMYVFISRTKANKKIEISSNWQNDFTSIKESLYTLVSDQAVLEDNTAKYTFIRFKDGKSQI